MAIMTYLESWRSASLSAYAALACALYLIYHLLSNRYQRHLYSIPGPYLASLTNWWRLIDVARGQAQQSHINLHKQYKSKLVRVGPRVVSISDPSAIPTIYSNNTGFYKTGFYPVQMNASKGKFMPSLFNTTDEAYHARIRRPIANAYSMSTLVDFEPLVDSTTQVFMKKLGEYADRGGQIVDLGVQLQRYAFDVIGEITFSRRLNFIESESDVDNIMANIKSKLIYSAIIGQMPQLDYLFSKNPILIRLFQPTHPIAAFTRDRLAERFSGQFTPPAGSRDFLTRTLEAKEKHPDVVDDGRVFSYNMANIFAGSDTTAISLRSIVYYLLKTPRALQRLIAEIDEMDQAGKLSPQVSWAQANQMPYLEAVIKEGLRMHPAAGLMLERHVPQQGVTIDGHFLPAGTIVGINPWVVHRNEDVYPDANTFNPERWFEKDTEKLKLMDRTMLTFGYTGSSRMCIGKNISLLEVYKVIPQLFREFELELEDPKAEWTLMCAWFVLQEGLRVKMTRRTRGTV